MFKKILHLILFLLTAGINISAYAITPGLYIGAGAGLAEIDSTDDDFSKLQNAYFPHVAHESGAISGRFFGGYNFNQYVGVEAGFATYPTNHFKAAFGAASASFSDNMNAFDIIGKAYLPFGGGKLSIYGLLGLAEVNKDVKFIVRNSLNDRVIRQQIRRTRPKFGGGLSYDFTPHLTGSVEYSRIQGTYRHNQTQLSNINAVTFSLSYNFG